MKELAGESDTIATNLHRILYKDKQANENFKVIECKSHVSGCNFLSVIICGLRCATYDLKAFPGKTIIFRLIKMRQRYPFRVDF